MEANGTIRSHEVLETAHRLPPTRVLRSRPVPAQQRGLSYRRSAVAPYETVGPRNLHHLKSYTCQGGKMHLSVYLGGEAQICGE